jgi:uncharacterized protein (DUF924 family)
LAISEAPIGPLPAEALGVLEFWFGPFGGALWGTERAEWFRKDDAFDARIRERFEALIERALRGPLDGWTPPWGTLAEIVVLDQFTRNVFRHTARSVAGDARALPLARTMVASGADLQVPPVQRSFVYLPFEHAESLDAQDESVRLFDALAAAHPPSASMRDYAERHREVIRRFGRFPHRNALLGRASTPEEAAFLKTPGSRF